MTGDRIRYEYDAGGRLMTMEDAFGQTTYAVSYTHLDVYKRQQKYSVLVIFFLMLMLTGCKKNKDNYFTEEGNFKVRCINSRQRDKMCIRHRQGIEHRPVSAGMERRIIVV